MDMSKIIAAAKAGMDVVQQLAPLAALGGPAAAGVANIVAGLTEVAENALDNIETGRAAASTDDQQELKNILASLQAKNDDLNAAIRDG